MGQLLDQLKTQFTEIWGRLSRLQRGVLVGLGTLGAVLMIVFVNWARTPDYAVAFRGLDEAEAGQIVEKLQEQGTPYKLGTGGAILVPRSSIYDVRLSMAKEGLPKAGTIGFELFDASSLGMTEFYQEVNYRRALEGELGRTISSLEAVEQARVHLVLPKQSLYSSQQADPSASVLLELAPGSSLGPEQIRSIRYLVASSVEDLAPENLTIVDTDGNTLSAGGGELSSRQLAVETTSQQMQAQRSYEQATEAEIQAMLEQLLGPGKAIVRCAAEMDWNQVETVSETYSPGTDEGVLRSSQETSEIYTGTALIAGGVPGTASNLPPEPGSGLTPTGSSGAEGGAYERHDVLHNYEVSRVESRSITPPGRIERLAVAVMLDGVEDAQQLADIEEAVATAAGLDTTRGDTISVKSHPFDRSFYDEETEAMEQAGRHELYLTAAKWVGLAILVVVVLLYVRGLLNSLRPSQMRVNRAGVEALAGAEPARIAAGGPPALEGPRELGEERVEELLEVKMDEEQRRARAARERIERQLHTLAEREPDVIAQVIRDWLYERE